MSALRASVRTLTLALLMLAISACSLFKPGPTVARLTIAGDSKLNVDNRGRSTPVVVRLYLLKNVAAFETADFFSLYEKDQVTLGDAIVWREELTMKPGELRRFDPRDAGEGKFVAALAAFRDVNKAGWRSTAQLIPNKTTEVLIMLSDDKLVLTPGVDQAALKQLGEKATNFDPALLKR